LSSLLYSQEISKEQIKLLEKLQGNELKANTSKKNSEESPNQQVIVNNVIKKVDKKKRQELDDEELETLQEKLITKENIEKALSIKPKKERYGSYFFNNVNNINPYSISTPEDYSMNYGDKLEIKIYGLEESNISVSINNNGFIELPNIGRVLILGKSFKETKKIVKNKIKNAYPNVNDILINIIEYSPIQIVISGEVEAPGLYNVSSFSTIKDAIIMSGGILDEGSYRNIVLKRKKRIIKRFDLYELLINGDMSSDTPLKNGDVIIVSNIEKEITISGDIKKSTKFELLNNESFRKLVKLAGGLKAKANKKAIKLKRFEENGLEVYNLTLSELYKMKPKDGDEIFIESKKFITTNFVSINGNVISSGERRLPLDKKLSTLIKSEIKKYGKDSYFLRDTNYSYGYVENYNSFKSFSLKNILNNKEEISLKKGDRIYITKDNTKITNSYIRVTGDILDLENVDKNDIETITTVVENKPTTEDIPKDDSSEDNITKDSIMVEEIVNTKTYQKVDYFSNLKIYDLFNILVFKDNSVDLDRTKIKITRKFNFKEFEFVVTEKEFNSFKLEEYDVVEFYNKSYLMENNSVVINGEVRLPGTYKVKDSARLRDVITLAGGFTKKTLYSKFEIVRHIVRNEKRERFIISKSLKESLDSNIIIKPDDEINIFSIPNWDEKKYVELKGQVKFPGKYQVQDGEKLSSVILRAGGFKDNAFLEGALFTREDTKKLQQKMLEEKLLNLEQKILEGSLNKDDLSSKEETSSLKTLSLLESLKEKYENNKPIGRISISLFYDLNRFKNSQFDISLKDKDTLVIPSINDTVTVIGEVLNQNTFIYQSKFDADDYIKKAGGLKETADTDLIYIVKSNGEAKRVTDDYFWNSGTEVFKGDTIIIPIKIDLVSNLAYAKDVSSIIYQLAVTAASLKTLGSL